MALVKTKNKVLCDRRFFKRPEEEKSVEGDLAEQEVAKLVANRGRLLTDEQEEVAGKAKMAAISILEDALKKTHLLVEGDTMKNCLGNQCSYAIRRFAAVTEQDVRDILEVMHKIQFKGDSSPLDFAYVYPNDKSYTVFLCDQFWKASPNLKKDSQPGTLIHEVSHFKGTLDLDYSQMALFVSTGGVPIEGKHVLDKDVTDAPGTLHDVVRDPKTGEPQLAIDITNLVMLKKCLLNANSLEYEFEMTLNHKGEHINGRYDCCKETDINSVCGKAITAIDILKQPVPVPHGQQGAGFKSDGPKRPGHVITEGSQEAGDKWETHEKSVISKGDTVEEDDAVDEYPNSAGEERFYLLPPGLDLVLKDI